MTEQEYQNRILELEFQVQILEHRLQGHREAVARWRQRAGVTPPVNEIELFKTEIYIFRGDFWTREYYTLPIEKNPYLLAEAWAWVVENGLNDMEICERVYFDQYDQKRGWVLIIAKPWRP